MAETTVKIKNGTGVDDIVPMASGASISAGDIVRYDADGYLEACVTDTTGTFVVGVALETYDNTAGDDGDYEVKINSFGIVYIAGSYSRADIGTKFYASTTAKILANSGTHAVAATLVEVDAGGGWFNFGLK